MIAAEALEREVGSRGWLKEILNAGFAIIHDKVVVIDPFSKNCVVITGSHNLGTRPPSTTTRTSWSAATGRSPPVTRRTCSTCTIISHGV